MTDRKRLSSREASNPGYHHHYLFQSLEEGGINNDVLGLIKTGPYSGITWDNIVDEARVLSMKILEKPDVDFDTMLTCINSAFDTLPQKQIEL